MAYVIKSEIPDPSAPIFEFNAAKTMYGGKLITPGDKAFLFASENAGGPGLVTLGFVICASPVERQAGPQRQTPRVSIAVERRLASRRRLGRAELKRFSDWNDGRPETELNFKLYRQATDKIVGISSAAEAFLDLFF